MKPLTSWKEIGAYLGRTPRTVQRWERQFGLPVHRVGGRGTGIIWAVPEEIDLWLRKQTGAVSPVGHSERDFITLVLNSEEPAQALSLLGKAVERQVQGYVSFLLLDDMRCRLFPVAAPSLPQSFRLACDATPIDRNVGTSAPAIFLNQVQVANDVASDPHCESFQPWAKRMGIAATVSVPIRAVDGRAFGAATIYYPHVQHAPPEHLRWLELAAELAAVVLRHTRSADGQPPGLKSPGAVQ